MVLLEQYWLSRVTCAYFQQVAKHIMETFQYFRGRGFSNINYENRIEYISDSIL